MKLSENELKEILYSMVKGRRVEEKITLLFREGKLRGYHHPAMGQEAAEIGVCYGLTSKDYVSCTHRGKSPEFMRGLRLKDLMAGYFAKKEGLGGGRIPTGSHCYGDLSIHVIPFSGIVGSSIPVAVGVGFGLNLDKSGAIIVCFFGDGASNRGDFHEGLNLASTFKLPVVFVIINNGYAISLSVKRATGLTKLSVRARGYGMPGVTVDGNDFFKVHKEASKAIRRARNGEGPTLLECMVHRWTGHSVTDPDTYRNDAEKRKGVKDDPIIKYKNQLINDGILSVVEYKRIEDRVKSEIDEAVIYAEKECSDPDPSDILRGVYDNK
jgi:TPP-dependent pyruvate/acetoin dehydrogenase alpha subunit